MANTYTQVYVMIVFGTRGRKNLITNEHEEEIYKYISGIISNKSKKILQINGMPDHVHILVSLKPDKAISDLVRDIKSNSSKFINESKWFAEKFNWQKGFGAFSYSHSQIEDVINYIKDQKVHHKRISFKDEYKKLLDYFEIEYDEKYILE
ncbi:MAG TPA: IS200/IS605 family transposase [Bacteroidetes bacterium]|nr:IS200/IS605 family transposase [Bacteroidota bacterium]